MKTNRILLASGGKGAKEVEARIKEDLYGKRDGTNPYEVVTAIDKTLINQAQHNTKAREDEIADGVDSSADIDQGDVRVITPAPNARAQRWLEQVKAQCSDLTITPNVPALRQGETVVPPTDWEAANFTTDPEERDVDLSWDPTDEQSEPAEQDDELMERRQVFPAAARLPDGTIDNGGGAL